MTDKQLVVSRVFKASIDRVFDAWTRPEEVKQWLSPEGMTVPEAVLDLNAGGAFTIVMQAADGTRHTGKGMFKTVEPMKKLVMSWAWEGDGMGDGETDVMVEFVKKGERETEVVLTHSGFGSDQSATEHTKGWTSTYNNLEKYLAK